VASNSLKSIADIFQRKVFRIPDYQRGYSWGKKQLTDFYEDLENLIKGRSHYTGVITLEDVKEDVYKNWHEDLWLIEGKNYTPYFIVDGQQRITTIIIFISVILEKLAGDDTLNYHSKGEIQTKYIYESKDKGISRTYIFGYEKDNPSYEYLKTRILNEKSNTNQDVETLYTTNLENTKKFFKRKIHNLDKNQLETLFKKISQQLKFNVYEIDDV
jgi:uncharacterized protein with ParB-like and HNH nuclease domain